MPAPMLFISHKHSDRKIAETLGTFLEKASAGRIKVHLSSAPDFEGPRFGAALNPQLRNALWNSDVLILVYTSPDQDWSYCMWECGLASHPRSPDTTIIVLQCGTDAPAPFQDAVRANARNVEDMKRLTDQLFRDAKLFPSVGAAIAPDLKDSLVEKLAGELHADLRNVLPRIDSSKVEQWPAWPFMRLELPQSETDRIEQASESERPSLAQQAVTEYAVVVTSDARAAQLFGRQGLPERTKLRDLLTLWKDKYPDADPGWFTSCCEQIMVCIRREFPVISGAAMQEIGGESRFTPVITRVNRRPFAGAVQFDMLFFNLSDPRAVLARSRMVPISDLFHKRLGEIDPKTLQLKNLVQELTAERRNRIPILTAEGAPLYIVHRSMIEQFIANRAFQMDSAQDPRTLTLADLLADPNMKSLFESFVVVGRQATLATANAVMNARKGCSDVFVTSGGLPGESVLGLLTNVDITRSS